MAVPIFLCYAAEDERMIQELKKHLSLLKRNRVIELWDYSDIRAGSNWEKETYKRLDKAQVILLLVSPSYFDSDYCYSIEMRAIERHKRKKAWVIPIILRPVRWEDSPLRDLQPLPDDGKPVIQRRYRDEGFANVAAGIAKVIEQLETADLSGRRKILIANFDQLIETVKSHMQPPPRAQATAHTLQQLSLFIPNDVALDDLIIGWQTLSFASKQGEDAATTQRRLTCGELANLASQFATGQGNTEQAIKTWKAWAEAFKKSDDPRQASMGRTFARELAELEEAAAKL